MSLITETNRQYYQGAQGFRITSSGGVGVPSPVTQFTTTFDTDLKFYGYSTTDTSEYALNNFKLYHSSTAAPGTWNEYTNFYSVTGNTITFGGSSTAGTAGTGVAYVDLITTSFTQTIEVGDYVIIEGAVFTGGVIPVAGRIWAQINNITTSVNPGATRYEWDPVVYGTATYDGPNIGGPGADVQVVPGIIFTNGHLVVQLKKLDGGEYGATPADKAYGNTVEQNYGSYAYVSLNDIVNNFIVAYVGAGKLIPSVKRTDLIFHAKRGLQEFSYDTLKSIKSQELTIPHSLSLPLPQDYVNYVRTSWIDSLGVQHIIYPTNNLTDSPYKMPLQDTKGVPVQDQFDDNIETTSITEERWKTNNTSLINQEFNQDQYNMGLDWWGYNWGYGGDFFWGYGQLYGNDPQTAQVNGWFNLNEREGKMSFSSNLRDQIIILEYISDGLSYDNDTKVPKMAEDALYAYMSHAVLASRINQPEYIIQRLKREASAKLRNTKIRLSNIKLDEIVQVMRGKSKWIKH